MRIRFLILSSVSFCALQAQQNFINVPSSEATRQGKLFFQQQINCNKIIQSNTTLDYGLGKGFEVGANVLGLNFSEQKRAFFKNDTNDVDPYNPLVMLNGLKQFEINKRFSVSVGGQYGFDITDIHNIKNARLAYGNLLAKDLLVKKSTWVFGCYYNSVHYGGLDGNRFGPWLGFEIPATQRLHFMAESIIGHNALAYTSLGCIYYPTPKTPITFGVQLPNTKSNAYSFVLELTYVP